jgi:citrate lyase subunit beta/citryl-CoA lyase
MQMGPIRTALFVPGSREDRFQKALDTGADKVIIDLEDAVPINGKDDARAAVARYLKTSAGPRIIIRVNGVTTPFFQADIGQVIGTAPVNLMVPKVESPQDLISVNESLLKMESEASLERGSVRIIALIETAMAVDGISEIVRTRTEPHRLHTIAFGAADYSADIGIEMTLEGTELIYPRSKLAVACRAGELEPPIDTPFMVDLKDLSALQRDARQARQFGFQGKLCIHPSQVDVINQVFSPKPEEVQRAMRIIEAFEEAEADGQGVLLVDGHFVDYPIVARARRILQIDLRRLAPAPARSSYGRLHPAPAGPPGEIV